MLSRALPRTAAPFLSTSTAVPLSLGVVVMEVVEGLVNMQGDSLTRMDVVLGTIAPLLIIPLPSSVSK